MRRQERNDLLAMLEGIAQNNGIKKEQLVEVVENAILTAARRCIHPANDLSVKLDLNTGDLRAWARLRVVQSNPSSEDLLYSEAIKKYPDVSLGDIVEWEVTPADFGRIAAQVARQNITQQIKDLLRRLAIAEYKDKVNQIISGVIHRVTPKGVIVEFERAQGIIPTSECINTERYIIGERISVLLKAINEKQNDPMLLLSRRAAVFLRRLFEREVSEIREGTVEIRAIVREPGYRAKVAVISHDDRIDPVGACIGMRGLRIHNIMEEINNERIDVIRYSDDRYEFLASALSPAKILNAEFNDEERTAIVYVDKENSSLAVGKKGQNMRLAGKITRWNLTLNVPETEEEVFEQKKKTAISALIKELEINEQAAAEIVKLGYLTMEGLCRAEHNELTGISALSKEDVARIEKKLEIYHNEINDEFDDDDEISQENGKNLKDSSIQNESKGKNQTGDDGKKEQEKEEEF